jgi:hypothetical protein
MVVNLIMRPCRLRSFANQTGPRRSETSGRADLSGTGHGDDRLEGLIPVGRWGMMAECGFW